MAVGLASGLVCVFDTRTSRVVRAVQLDHRVTAVEVVSTGAKCPHPGGTRLDPLTDFWGVLAVGTQEGHVMLLDLCLDDDTDVETDESDPAEVYEVTDDNADNDNWGQARVDCAASGKHLCRMLNHFAYKKVSDS